MEESAALDFVVKGLRQIKGWNNSWSKKKDRGQGNPSNFKEDGDEIDWPWAVIVSTGPKKEMGATTRERNFL